MSSQEPQQSGNRSAQSLPRVNTFSSWEPVSCDDVLNYCILALVNFANIGSVVMSVMYRAAVVEWPVS